MSTTRAKADKIAPILKGDKQTGSGKPLVGVVVVDDHVFMRDLMVRMLSRQTSRYKVLAAVGTSADAVTTCKQLTPDLLILDINLPDCSGIDILPELKRIAPATRVLLCTAYATDDRIIDSAHAGAHGFVKKTNTWDDFLDAVDRVSHGESYFCADAAGEMPADTPLDTVRMALTPRETEVIKLIAHGRTSKEIAAQLNISAATVETHRTNLMTKLGLRNVAAVVSYAFHEGLIKGP